MRSLSLCIIAGLLMALAAAEAAPGKDLKQLGTERTVAYQAALKRWSNDRLVAQLLADEAMFKDKSKAAEAAGEREHAALLGKAAGTAHMEKRFYLRLLDADFNRACQAFDDADPAFIGTKTAQP
jgi:hypothetical protein